MPADRLLGTLIRSLQTYTDQQDTPRLLSTAASLLISLQNPLNITLLTNQLLTAPALWHRPEGLQTCFRLIGVFNSAALALLKREEEDAVDTRSQWYPTPSQGIPKDAWIKAVLKGADERSPAWKHTMLFAGLIIGFGPAEEERLGTGLRATLEQELIKAVNSALMEVRGGEEELAVQCITMSLNHSFGLLSDFERAGIDYDLLLPALVGTAFFSNEGLQGAYFLGAVDLDLMKMPDGKLHWRDNCQSFRHVDIMLSRPIVSALGPLSRLISHSVENVRDSRLVQTMVDDLTAFTRSVLTQWRQTRLSNIDVHEEAQKMSEETLQRTMPLLWKLLRSALFAVIIVFRGAVGRLLGDRVLASDLVAPTFVTQVLHSLRHFWFVASRMGANSFSQYNFVYLTCIDILSAYPGPSDSFLQLIRPATLGSIPSYPIDRTLDLFFLDIAEHFSLVLSPQTNENLLVAAAIPYLAAGGASHMLPLFEAAHSVMLAVLSAPQSADTAAKHAPFYVEALFAAFPANLSPRQFRLAFKTLLRVATPPSSLSASHPLLPAILLELVHHRALHAPTVPLPTPAAAPNPFAAAEEAGAEPTSSPSSLLSEQAVLTLTLIDVLPLLPVDQLDEWLPLSAQLVNAIPDEDMKQSCRLRFWEVLMNGDMDPERSMVCVSWWGSRGGRDMVMGYGASAEQQQQQIMNVNGGGRGEAMSGDTKL